MIFKLIKNIICISIKAEGILTWEIKILTQWVRMSTAWGSVHVTKIYIIIVLVRPCTATSVFGCVVLFPPKTIF